MKLQTPRTYGLLTLIVLAALFLRVYNLGNDASFTTDEVTTVTNSMQKLFEIPKLESSTPLQALWIKFGAQVLGLGYSESSIFFLSVILGLLAIFVIFKIGKSLFDDHIGLLCAFLLAFSIYNIYWSRSARYYALMVLLSSASFLCLYWALISNQKRMWLLYALFRILSLYDHLTAIWMFFGEVIFGLGYLSIPLFRNIWNRWREGDIRQKIRSLTINWKFLHQIPSKRIFWLTISFSLVVLAYTPVWYSMLHEILQGNSILRVGGLSSGQMTPIDIRTGQLQPILGGGWRGPLLVFEQLTAWIVPLHIIYIILFIFGVIFCVVKRNWTQLFFTMTIIITPFILSIFIKSYSLVLDGRYLISLLPLYFLIVACGIDGITQKIGNISRLPRNIAKYSYLITVAICVVVIAGLNLTRIPLTFRNTGHNWRAVSRFLAQNAKPDELIIVPGEAPHYKALQYYLPGFNVVQNDPMISYDTLYKQEKEFWLVIEMGTNLYNGLRYWTDNVGAVSIIFASGWYPDIDQNSDLAPAQNWDLYVVHVDHVKRSSQQALALHNDWLAEAKSNNPGDVRWHLTLAEAYQRYNDCWDAIDEYNEGLNEGYVNDQLASYIYDARAVCWSILGNEEFAIADWQKAISRAKWSEEPYKRLYYYYISSAKLSEAQGVWETASHANPQKAWPLIMQADYYRTRGLVEMAISTYIKAIELEPTGYTTYQHLAETYMAKGEYDKVISLYRNTMRRNPWFGWLQFQLGQFYNSMGRVTEALLEYQKAVALQPELAPAVSEFMLKTNWNLANNIYLVQAHSDQGDPLQWLDNSWIKLFQTGLQRLIGHSTLTVNRRVQPDQLLLHPFSNNIDTVIEFEIPQIYFTQIKVGAGLADKVARLSNGCRYQIEVRTQDEGEYHVLLDLLVDDNIWQEKTVSLLPYWGEDLEFRLVVGAQGDDTYDWLQTTFELEPPPLPAWDLLDNLNKSQLSAVDQTVVLGQDGFYSSTGARLVGYSQQPVNDRSLSGQMIFHPYSAETSSTLTFSVHNYNYKFLKTWFGLADMEVASSNGVEYTVSVSIDGGLTFRELVQSIVTTSNWQSNLVELPQAQDYVFKLSSSSLGNIDYYWLQVRLDLLPGGNE